MKIERKLYLDRLIDRKHNGFVKIITGIRRCGKSYLLFNLFREHLLSTGVKPSQIIAIALDDDANKGLRNSILLGEWIRRQIKGRGMHYVFIDEIQMAQKVLPDGVDLSRIAPEDRESAYVTFYDVLNGLMKLPNVDVYVTGSNSKMLSSDIATNFRDRGDEIRVHPLTFAECLSVSGKEKAETWADYLVYGGMPGIVEKKSAEQKKDYLRQLFAKVYFKDIVERHKLRQDRLLENVTDVLFSVVGSLTNPTKLADTLGTVQKLKVSQPTVKKYMDILQESFLVNRVERYDVKGRRYMDFPSKYYAEDIGLRNARINYRQTEEAHLMENVICNELLARGYAVDVGMVETVDIVKGKREKRQREIDFIVNTGSRKVYIQSALRIDSEEKLRQETESLRRSGDFFRKFVVTSGFSLPSEASDGIITVGVIPFLLDRLILDVRSS